MIYQQALRATSPSRWRPLLSLVQLLMTAFVAYVTWALATLGLADAFHPVEVAVNGGAHRDLFDLLSNNLILACAVPVTMFATWSVYRTAGLLVSVAGRLRRGLLAFCAAAAMVVQVVGVGVTSLVTGDAPHGHGADVAALLAVVLLTTPLQAAGEEFFFRGWIPQQIGVLVRNPRAALVLGTLLSSALFAWAHGQQNPWLAADRFGFGLLACLLVWRTGGLESSIAMHAVNNIVVFVPVILAGQLHDALLVSQASAGAVAADLVILVVYVAVVLAVLRRRARRTPPSLTPTR